MAEEKKTHHQNVKVENKEKSTKEITGEVSAERMNELREGAIDNLAKNVEVDGFRKGKAPRNKVIEHVGETRILEEAANIALSEAYPAIVTEHGIQAIGQPHVAITKLAAGNELGFKITTAVVPTVKLDNYKKIAEDMRKNHKKEEVKVEEKEIEETINQVRKNIAMQRAMEAQKNFKPGEEPQMPEVKDEDLPELDDEFVKTLGDFENVEDFKTKLTENIKEEKERKNRESLRQTIADKLVEKAEIDVPDLVVEAELDKMLARLKDDIAKAGLEFNEYLKKIEKTNESLRDEWRESAEKKAKMQLILNKIAAEEKIEANKEKLELETAQLKQFYPDADDAAIQTYIESYLINEEVFQFLEGNKEK